MRITYDPEVDALYIRFTETTVTTAHLAEGIAADYDAEGRLAGIEILDARNRLSDPQAFKKITLENIAVSSG
jgi:YD repeat-containing protein